MKDKEIEIAITAFYEEKEECLHESTDKVKLVKGYSKIVKRIIKGSEKSQDRLREV